MSEIIETFGQPKEKENCSERLHSEVFRFLPAEREKSFHNGSPCKAVDPFASHRQREPYPGYYDRISKERKELNDQLTTVFEPIEKIVGFAIGSYGIFGGAVKSRRKWLNPPDWLVQKLPSEKEIECLSQLSIKLKNLTGANASEGAAILRQAKVIENQILVRSRFHAFGGLAVGLGASHLADRLFFKEDTLGDGSAMADLAAAPLLAWRVPGNFLTKAAAVLAVELAGKLIDHFRQPHYVYDPRAEQKSSTLPDCDMMIAAPGATPLPRSIFTREDIEIQRLNWARQRSEFKVPKE